MRDMSPTSPRSSFQGCDEVKQGREVSKGRDGLLITAGEINWPFPSEWRQRRYMRDKLKRCTS